MYSFVRIFASCMLTCMVSVLCVLGFSIQAIATTAIPQGVETQQLYSASKTEVVQNKESFVFANTSIELPTLTATVDASEGVVYSDNTLLSKKTSFLL